MSMKSKSEDLQLKVKELEELAEDTAFGMATLRRRAEHERVEAALLESEARYRSIFNSMRDGVAITDTNGNLIDVNPEYCRMHGYSREELIGMNARRLLDPSRWSRLEEFLREVGEGRDCRREGIYVRKDGGRKHYEARGTRTRIQGKDFCLTILRDISERVMTAQALQDHLSFQSVLARIHSVKAEESDEVLIQALLSEIVEQYPFRMAWFGRLENGIIRPSLFAGHADRYLDGLALEIKQPESPDRLCAMSIAVLSRKPFGYTDLEHDEGFRAWRDYALELGYRSNLALPVIVNGSVEGGILVYCETPDGFPQERVDRLRLISDELGRALNERRERRKVGEELQRLAIAVEQAAEEVLITDPDGTIQYVNPAFERITGYSREEALGKNPRILKSGRHELAFYQALWGELKKGKVWKGRIVNRHKAGRLIEEDATISPITDSVGDIVGYVSVKRDVTEQIRLERQLRQSQKLEAIGTLAGGIAHDFNNILGVIIGYGEMAQLFHAPEGSPIRSYLGEVLEAAARARDLVGQILTFSRKSEHEKKPTSLDSITKEALKFLRASLPSTITIQQEILTEGAYVLADPVQMHQVLMNLCTNSAHAMRQKGGTLTVGLRNVLLNEEWTERPVDLQPGPYVELRVSDTGEGIPTEYLERIFEPYFTTKEKGEGTGLGLAVVHGIVQSHGGAVRVYSEPGKGTAFTILFPSLTGTTNEPSDPLCRALPTGSERILFVDDEESLVTVGRQALVRLGYQVTCETDSTRALELFRQDPDRYDLVVTDLTMPKLTGTELAEEIKRIRTDIPVVLCSGFSGALARQQADASGIEEFLNKPFRLHDLAQVIRKVLDRSATESNDGGSGI